VFSLRRSEAVLVLIKQLKELLYDFYDGETIVVNELKVDGGPKLHISGPTAKYPKTKTHGDIDDLILLVSFVD